MKRERPIKVVVDYICWQERQHDYQPRRTPTLTIHGQTVTGRAIEVKLRLEPIDASMLRNELRAIAEEESQAWASAVRTD